MSSMTRCGVGSTCLTLIVSPDSAGGGLGRARVVSQRRVLFSFFGQNIPSIYSYVHIHTILGLCMQEIGWGSTEVAVPATSVCRDSDLGMRGSNLGWRLFFVFVCYFHFFLFQWKNTYDDDWGVVWAIEKSVLYAYRVLLPLLLLLLLLLLLCLLLYCCCCYSSSAVRHRVPDGQICCWFIESHHSVFFLFIQTRFILDGTPWQSYCVAFSASICLHPRKWRACAEPRQASARSGVAPLYHVVSYHSTILLISMFLLRKEN